MNRSSILSILFSLLIIASCKSSSKKEDVNKWKSDKGIFLSLYVYKTDELKKSSVGEIIVFGKYLDGVYTPISDYDAASQQSIANRLNILKNHKDYNVYFHGQNIKRISINIIDSTLYYCDYVTVGQCNNSISPKIINQRKKENKQGIAGYSKEEDTKFSWTNFIALSSNHPFTPKTFFKQVLINAQQNKLINEDLKNKFKHYNDTLTYYDITRKSIAQVFFANDIGPTFISVALCSDTSKEVIISQISIFKINSDKIETLFEKYNDVDQGSWGEGYVYIDAVDVDSDNNPELFFQIDGYEGSGIEVYKYDNGKFKLVLETDLYGC